MTSLRGVRESLRALRDQMTIGQRRLVWLSYEARESHEDAVERTLAERGLTGDEPGLMLISWLPPVQDGADNRGVIR